MVIQENPQKQEELEALLLQTWAQGCPETSTVEEVFGPYESWLLPLGTHLLLLHPVLKEWLYLDRLHDTWQRTGFGPREVVFVARAKMLGVRRRERAAGVSPVMAETVTCPACHHPNAPGMSFCTECGVVLEVPQPQATVQSQELTCPACHHPNTPGANFCIECGARLS